MTPTWKRIKENPTLLPQYLVREQVMDVIRSYFKAQGFHEVFTPILVPIPSAESNLEVFETELRTLTGKKRRGFLTMSPEYSLKKLVAAGVGSVFEITHSFRNEEEVSPTHNPEFTMLEWYRVNADYTDVMHDFETLFNQIISTVQPKTPLSAFIYQGEAYDLTLPWPRISVAEAFKKYALVETQDLLSDRLLRIAKDKGYVVNDETTWEQVFYQIFFNEIEPALKASHKPVIIYDYPLSQAALARKKKADPRLAERFEVFLAGMELGNCFSELIDPNEQTSRFKQDIMERKRLAKTEYPMDADLIEALKSGMPNFGGIAVGVDRLIMLAADVERVAEVTFFPADELFDLSGKLE